MSFTFKVKCSLCGEVFECTKNDISSILDHIKEFHPEISLVDSQSNEKTKPSEKHKPNSKTKTLYKQSIESWDPRSGNIFCPVCNMKRKPVSKNEKGGCCWLCYCCCGSGSVQSNLQYLHCPACDSFLGLFDSVKCTIKPNVKFVEKGQEGIVTMNTCSEVGAAEVANNDNEKGPEGDTGNQQKEAENKKDVRKSKKK